MKKINKIFVGAVSTAMVITSVGVSYSYAKNIGSYAIDNSILKNGNAIYTNRNIIDNKIKKIPKSPKALKTIMNSFKALGKLSNNSENHIAILLSNGFDRMWVSIINSSYLYL